MVLLHLGVDEAKVTGASFKDFGADSLDTVKLVMALENEFGCEIPNGGIDGSSHCFSLLRDTIADDRSIATILQQLDQLGGLLLVQQRLRESLLSMVMLPAPGARRPVRA